MFSRGISLPASGNTMAAEHPSNGAYGTYPVPARRTLAVSGQDSQLCRLRRDPIREIVVITGFPNWIAMQRSRWQWVVPKSAWR